MNKWRNNTNHSSLSLKQPHITRYVGVDFLVQGLQHIGIDGQAVQNISESGCGGLVATKDEDEGLGKNLVFSQTCQSQIERQAEVFISDSAYM